jgi:cbb3-type cytochrome oxidase maturation protein
MVATLGGRPGHGQQFAAGHPQLAAPGALNGRRCTVDILYLLIPLSAVLVLLILAIFGWALHRGQFDDVEREGSRILQNDPAPVDGDQASRQVRPEQSGDRQSGQS